VVRSGGQGQGLALTNQCARFVSDLHRGQAMRERQDAPASSGCSRRRRAPQALAAVLHTPTALCLVDFAAPAPPSPAPRSGAQRRADCRARRPRDEGLGHRPGDNFRVLPLEHPCLHAGYLAPAAALLARARPAGRG